MITLGYHLHNSRNREKFAVAASAVAFMVIGTCTILIGICWALFDAIHYKKEAESRRRSSRTNSRVGQARRHSLPHLHYGPGSRTGDLLAGCPTIAGMLDSPPEYSTVVPMGMNNTINNHPGATVIKIERDTDDSLPPAYDEALKIMGSKVIKPEPTRDQLSPTTSSKSHDPGPCLDSSRRGSV